jgi:hypothetical protein
MAISSFWPVCVNKKFSKRAEKVKFEYLFYLKEVSYGLQNCCGWCHW